MAAAASVALAALGDISYPVEELGSCQHEQECRAYCDLPGNREACLAFAEKHGLLPQEDIEQARRFLAVGTGPGGCETASECEAYCGDLDHLQECVAFAQEHGFMTGEELREAKLVADAMRRGIRPPDECATKDACEAFCEDPRNLPQCLAFAEEAGLLQGEELEEARKIVRALEAGASLPGDCRSEAECETYCREPAHMEECIAFAEAAGFMTKEELEEARRIMPLMAQGKMPGGCSGREECEDYCGRPENADECAAFFVEAGFMTREQAEIYRKTGGVGPGGCRREECETFCDDPANQRVCFEFAREHGLLSEEDLRRIEEGEERIRREMEAAPPSVRLCMEEAGLLEAARNPDPFQMSEVGDRLRLCMEREMQARVQECLAAPCSEALLCLEGLAGSEGDSRPDEAGEKDGTGLDRAIEEKVAFCMEEMAQEASGEDPCVENMLRGLSGPPGPSLEQRIAEECFGAPSGIPFKELGPGSLSSAFSPLLGSPLVRIFSWLLSMLGR